MKTPQARLFIPGFVGPSGEVPLSDFQRQHLRVLRIAPDQVLLLFTPTEEIYTEVVSFSKRLYVRERSRRLLPPEKVAIHLVQCLPKGDKIGDIVQSCTELGVSRITPVISSRSISWPDEKSAANKRERWQTIAESAATQSRQLRCPVVDPIALLSEWTFSAADYDLCVVCWEEAPIADSLVSLVASRDGGVSSVLLLIGPESGLEKAEVSRLSGMGMMPRSLGPTILRVEHAGFYACAQLQSVVALMRG